MSITSPDLRISTYNPVVATTIFAAQFPVFDNADLKVYLDTGDGSGMLEQTGFTVSATYIDGISNNAQVAFVTGLVGQVMVIGYRDPHRANRFSAGAPLPIWAQNLALDTLEAELQELRRDVNLSVKVGYGQLPNDFPPPSDQKVLGWSGQQLANLDPGDFVAAAGTIPLTWASSTVGIGLIPRFADFLGTPTLFSTHSVYMLASGAPGDTMNWYFQREAGYTGGAAGDTAAGVNSPIRSEVNVRSSVTHVVETGVVGISNNESTLAQAVGVVGQGNSLHGGRVWGAVFEGHELYEEFTAANDGSGNPQSIFPIPNGYTAGSLFALVGGSQIARGGGAGQYVDSSGTNLVINGGVTAGTKVRAWKGDPQQSTLGTEINVFPAYGNDTYNTVTGNRVVVAAIPKRQDGALNVDAHIGAGFLMSANSDPYIVVDRAFAGIGRITRGIDFTGATLGTHILKAPGAEISNLGNVNIGNLTAFAVSGYATMQLGQSTNGGLMRIGDGAHTLRLGSGSSFGCAIGSETADDLQILAGSASTAKWRFMTTGVFRPEIDNSYSLGSASFRPSQIFAGTATISTSDERLKQDIRPISDAERPVAVACRSLLKAYRFKDAVAKKNEQARIHYGAIAQEIMAAFTAGGLDAMRYGIVCCDPVTAMREVTTTISVPKTETTTIKDYEIQIIDGIAVQVEVERQQEVQVFDEYDLHDADGNIVTFPVYESVPRLLPAQTYTDYEGVIRTIPERTIYERQYVRDEVSKHRVPATEQQQIVTMEEYDTKEVRYGLRYTELLCFILAAY